MALQPVVRKKTFISKFALNVNLDASVGVGLGMFGIEAHVAIGVDITTPKALAPTIQGGASSRITIKL